MWIINGRRVTSLLRTDLPTVAKAIVCTARRVGLIDVEFARSTPLIHMSGRGYDIYIRGDDWEKIVPFLADGSLSPDIIAPVRFLLDGQGFDPSDIEIEDRDFYRRVLGVLMMLFTKDFPTSKL